MLKLRTVIVAAAFVLAVVPFAPRADAATPAAAAPAPRQWVAVGAGTYHSCGLTTTGGVACWGKNTYGQLGDATTSDRYQPSAVAGLSSGVASISVGGESTCALTEAGSVTCWGNNDTGQLGDGTTTSRSTPVQVIGLTSSVTAIANGSSSACALRDEGTVSCWGFNGAGQLGDGTTTTTSTPVEVAGLDDAVDIVMGSSFGCAVTSAHGVKCWGTAYFDPDLDWSTRMVSPTDIPGLTAGVTDLDGAEHFGQLGHLCAIVGGIARCAGANPFGELGDGTTDWSTSLTSVVGLPAAPTQISAGGAHTCALTAADGLWCWGRNSIGQPQVLLTPTIDDAVSVSVGGSHTCAVTASASISCWGDNDHGQLGNGNNRPTFQYVTVVDGPLTISPTVELVAEGSTGDHTASLTLTLSAPSPDPVTVEWNTLEVAGAPGNQAQAGSDYAVAGGTVTFAPEQTDASVELTVHGDQADEPDEYVVVSFHDPSGAQMGGFWGLGFLVLTDDDVPVVQPGQATVAEGDAGTIVAQVPVTLDRPSWRPIEVRWRTIMAPGSLTGQASSGSDYVVAQGTVTFQPGETAKIVPVTVNADLLAEGDEYVLVGFTTTSTNAVNGGVWGLGFVVITDDD